MKTYQLKTDGGPNATIKAANDADAAKAAIDLMTRDGFSDSDSPVTPDEAGWNNGELCFGRVGRNADYVAAVLTRIG